MTQMQCIEIQQAGGPEVLVPASRERPLPGVDEVLIEVAAAGVNRPDVMQRRGLYPAPPGASDLPGLEVAGTVVAVGDQVSQWQLGDRVCALTNGGGYAEFASAPEGQCLPVPGTLTWVESAALPETFFTVWTNVFQRARLQAGERLLVHGGSSGIGVAAIQMATALGARVYATAGSAEKCAACEHLGAETAVNYREQDFLEAFKAITDGEGMDVILDMVGGDYVAKNLQLAAVEGRVVNIAFQQGFETTVNFVPLLTKRLTLCGSTLRPQSSAAKAVIADNLRSRVWPLLATGEIKPVIAAQFPLAAAADAHRLMESSQHIGKIVLVVKA